MLQTRIARRQMAAFVFLSVAALSLFGGWLIHYFHATGMQAAEDGLITNARVIEHTLSGRLYDAPEKLQDIVDHISADTDLRITVIDADGNVLADSSHPADGLDNHLGREEIQAALQKHRFGKAVRYSSTLKQDMMYVAIPVYDEIGNLDGIIRTAAPLTRVETAFDRSRQGIVAALIVTFVLAVILSLWLSSRLTKPLHTIILATSAIAGGELSRRINIHTGDEFEILSKTLNHLTASLSQEIRRARAENRKLNLIWDHMDNAVLLLSADGKILTANRQAMRTFALSPADLYHHSIHVLNSATISETACDVQKKGEEKLESVTLDLQGRPHTFQVFFSVLPEDGEAPTVLAVFHDVSLLQEMNNRQTAFVSNAAHELRTPLTSIAGFAEILKEDDFHDPEQSRHFAATIWQQSQRMKKLINDLLQIARLDATDKAALVRSPVDVCQALRRTAAQLKSRIDAKRQTITIDVPQESIVIQATEDLFQQICLNLTENASKYTPEGGHIELSCGQDENHVFLTVRDTGIGIAPKDQPFVFDRFFRVDKSRSRAAGGNGIGLSLVKYLTELFHGKITLTSEQGKGTTFCITFPAAIHKS